MRSASDSIPLRHRAPVHKSTSGMFSSAARPRRVCQSGRIEDETAKRRWDGQGSVFERPELSAYEVSYPTGNFIVGAVSKPVHRRCGRKARTAKRLSVRT